MRTVQKVTIGFRGAVIGWGIPQSMDPDLRAVLPDWTILATDLAPLTVTQQTRNEVRRAVLAGGDLSDVPLILLGYGAGCATVAAALISHVFPEPWGVAALDGVHGSAARDAQVWAQRIALARQPGPSHPFLATALDVGPCDAARVLATALGLAVGAVLEDIQDGPLTVITVPESKDGKPRDVIKLLVKLAHGPE